MLEFGVFEGKILKFSWGFAPNPIGGGLQRPQTPSCFIRAYGAQPTDFVGRLLASLVFSAREKWGRKQLF